MKKILSLILLISMFGINFVNADYNSNTYISLHKNNFNNPDLISTNLKKEYYIVRYTGITNQTYQYNLRFFVPNLTKRVDISLGRRGSVGWLEGMLSMGKLPSFGKNNEYKNGKYSMAKYHPIYGGEYKKDGILYNWKTLATEDYRAKLFPNLIDGLTMRFYQELGIFFRANIATNIQESLNKWVYFATEVRPKSANMGNAMNAMRINYTIIYQLDVEKVDKYVDDNNLIEKMGKVSCNFDSSLKIDVTKACYYIKSFGLDGDDRDISTHSQTAKNFNNLSSTTQTPPINPNIEVETPSLTKKTSTIVLKKGLNLVGFKGDTKLSDLSGCNIGRYTKGQYNGKKSIFGVKGQNFIITPNNAETSTFTDEMGVFIFVTSDCSLKYSYLSEKQTELISCVGLGGAGPNGSLGPNDPNKNKKCCSGLKLINNGYNKDGYMLIGAGTICAKVGDGICDNKYENRFNSDDCR